MAALDAYPTLREYVFTDTWAGRFLSELLAKDARNEVLTFPDPYIGVCYERMGVLPAGWLSRLEAGLKFIVSRASKQNRNDAIGNLRDSVSGAAAFEIIVIGDIASAFGEEQTEPYPRIPGEGKKTVECAAKVNGARVCFEATLLYNDAGSADTTSYCLRKGVLPPVAWVAGDEGVARLSMKAQDKASQRQVTDPLVLCLNQLCLSPDCHQGTKAMHDLAEWANSEPGCSMVAVAYYVNWRLHAFVVADAVAGRLGVDGDVLAQVHDALKVL